MCMVMGCPNSFCKIADARRGDQNEPLSTGCHSIELWCPGEDSNSPRPNGHWHLKPARLPIPPPGHVVSNAQNGRLNHESENSYKRSRVNLFHVPIHGRFMLGVKCLFGDIFLRFAEINLQVNANLPHWDCKEVRHDLRLVMVLQTYSNCSGVRDCRNGTAATI